MDALIAHVAGSVAIEALIGMATCARPSGADALDERAADADTPPTPCPSVPGAPPVGAGRSRACDRRARRGGCRSGPASGGRPPRAGPNAPLARMRSAKGAGQARCPRDPGACLRDLRAAGCVGRQGALGAPPDRRACRPGGELGDRTTDRRARGLGHGTAVANELNLSPNTVAWNLSKIYRSASPEPSWQRDASRQR
jgi:hypothetical protein